MKTTVIIPNYNGKEYLRSCLGDLKQSEKTDFHTIVVDNGSTDDSCRMVKEEFPWAELIERGENGGFSAAVNEGIRRAETEYVLLLNNDAYVTRDFVYELERCMEQLKKHHKKCFSVSGRLRQMNKAALIDDAGDFYCALGWAFARGKGKYYTHHNRRTEIFASCAGAAIYQRELLLKLGLFDEQHFMYLEDIDIGYRARICGFHNYFCPKADAFHFGSASSGSRYNAFKVEYAARNSIYLIAKNMPLLQILLNLPFLFAGYLIKTIFFIRKGFGMAYLKGLIKGFRLSFSEEGRAKRVPFKRRNLKNYVQIQIELWGNILRRVWDI